MQDSGRGFFMRIVLVSNLCNMNPVSKRMHERYVAHRLSALALIIKNKTLKSLKE